MPNKGTKEHEICHRLWDYAAGKTLLKDVMKWFIPIAWDTDSMRPYMKDLVYEVQLRLAEYSNGHWTEEELKSKIRIAVFTYAQ